MTVNFVKNSNSDCGEVRPGVISYDEDTRKKGHLMLEDFVKMILYLSNSQMPLIFEKLYLGINVIKVNVIKINVIKINVIKINVI